MSIPAGKRLPRAVREQQMLDAAVSVFSRLGYHAASVDEIAESAGISKPMVYAYLGSKEELFTACLYREGARLMEAVAVTIGLDESPGLQLRNALRGFFGFVATHRDGWAVLYRQARAQEPFVSAMAEMRRRWIEIVAGLLRRADPAATDVTPTAYALVGAAESLADWIVEHGAGDPETLAARLSALILSGQDRDAGQHGEDQSDPGEGRDLHR